MERIRWITRIIDIYGWIGGVGGGGVTENAEERSGMNLSGFRGRGVFMGSYRDDRG